MTISHEDIAPLLRFEDERAAKRCFESVLLPLAQAIGGKFRVDTRDELVQEMLVHVWTQARDHKLDPKQRDCTGYFVRIFTNRANDVLARQKDKRLDDAEDLPAPVEDALEKREIPEALHELALAHPLPFVGFYSWKHPLLLQQPLLEKAKETPERGRKTTVTGLARDVAPTLSLLRDHHEEVKAGASGNREVQRRFGWIFRAEHPTYEVWRRDERGMLKAVETLVKWNQRGRKILKENRPALAREVDHG